MFFPKKNPNPIAHFDPSQWLESRKTQPVEQATHHIPWTGAHSNNSMTNFGRRVSPSMYFVSKVNGCGAEAGSGMKLYFAVGTRWQFSVSYGCFTPLLRSKRTYIEIYLDQLLAVKTIPTLNKLVIPIAFQRKPLSSYCWRGGLAWKFNERTSTNENLESRRFLSTSAFV